MWTKERRGIMHLVSQSTQVSNGSRNYASETRRVHGKTPRQAHTTNDKSIITIPSLPPIAGNTCNHRILRKRKAKPARS